MGSSVNESHNSTYPKHRMNTPLMNRLTDRARHFSVDSLGPSCHARNEYVKRRRSLSQLQTDKPIKMKDLLLFNAILR